MTSRPGNGRAQQRWEQAQRAIRLSLENKWKEAVEANVEFLEVYPDDLEAHNRLGRAYMELGQYEEARQAFTKAQEVSPGNPIAKRNLEKLASLGPLPPTASKEAPQISPSLFVEETGKTTVVELQTPASEEVIRRLSGGEPVFLVRKEGTRLVVQNRHGDYVGEIEPKLAIRVINLVDGGNEYAAAVVNVNGPRVRVIVKETFQHPSQASKVSFPSSQAESLRSYVKSSLLQYGAAPAPEPVYEEEDEEEDEERDARLRKSAEAKIDEDEDFVDEEDDEEEEEEAENEEEEEEEEAMDLADEEEPEVVAIDEVEEDDEDEEEEET